MPDGAGLLEPLDVERPELELLEPPFGAALVEPAGLLALLVAPAPAGWLVEVW